MYCVYLIICTPNNKFYVGSSVDVRQRKNNHYSQLRKGAHNNTYLQRAYNKYGKKAFKFEIIESCLSFKDMLEREQYWLDKLRAAERKFGYNLRAKAESQEGTKRSKEFCEHNSKLKMGNKNCVGRVLSKETKKKISETIKRRHRNK